MKRLLLFFFCLLLLVLMSGAIVLSGFIYDTGQRATTETYFFQPDDNVARRPGVPASPSDLGDVSVRDLLIAKYITEYFYVTPDLSDFERRRAGRTALVRLSTASSYQTWLETSAPEIEKLAGQGVLRTVKMISASQRPNEKYWEIVYELKTWTVPNDFSVAPTISRGILYLDILYEPGMRTQINNKSINHYLESGGDPAAVFRFKVLDVASQN